MRLAIAVGLLLMPSMAWGQDKPSTAADAIGAYKKALEMGDVKLLGELTAGKEGEILRALTEPLAKAKSASDKFEESLRDKAIPLNNPFAASVMPLTDWQFEVVELPRKTGDQIVFLARVGPRGRTTEEGLIVSDKEGAWRLTAPNDLARTLKPLADAKAMDQHRQALARLAEILTSATDDVNKGNARTPATVLLRLAKLVADAKLPEVLKP